MIVVNGRKDPVMGLSSAGLTLNLAVESLFAILCPVTLVLPPVPGRH